MQRVVLTATYSSACNPVRLSFRCEEIIAKGADSTAPSTGAACSEPSFSVGFLRLLQKLLPTMRSRLVMSGTDGAEK